jgi:AcrR family transcriptional regulator
MSLRSGAQVQGGGPADEWLTPRQCDILDVARRLLAGEGATAISMGRLSRELGISPSTLREHFSGPDEVLAQLTVDGLIEQAMALRRAGSDLFAQARAYRRFARDQPELYRLITERRLPDPDLGDALGGTAARPVLDALGPDLAPAAWAFAHGMVELELDERFPPGTDLDAIWRNGVAVFVAAAQAQRRPLQLVR